MPSNDIQLPVVNTFLLSACHVEKSTQVLGKKILTCLAYSKKQLAMRTLFFLLFLDPNGNVQYAS